MVPSKNAFLLLGSSTARQHLTAVLLTQESTQSVSEWRRCVLWVNHSALKCSAPQILWGKHCTTHYVSQESPDFIFLKSLSLTHRKPQFCMLSSRASFATSSVSKSIRSWWVSGSEAFVLFQWINPKAWHPPSAVKGTGEGGVWDPGGSQK